MALPFINSWKYYLYGNISSRKWVYPWTTTPIYRTVTAKYDPYMKLENWDMGYYGIWPFPKLRENNILLVDGNYLKTVRNPIYGFADINRFVIGVWSKDSDETIGNRIWHEMIHAHNINCDLLGPNQPNSDFPAFYRFVKSDPAFSKNAEINYYLNNAQVSPYEINSVSRAYYTMLWKRAGYPM